MRRFVGASVGLFSAMWKNGGSDPDAVWHHRSNGSRDEAGSGVWGSVDGTGYFWDDFGTHHCNQWVLTFAATRPSSQITLDRLVIFVLTAEILIYGEQRL